MLRGQRSATMGDHGRPTHRFPQQSLYLFPLPQGHGAFRLREGAGALSPIRGTSDPGGLHVRPTIPQ